MKREAIFDKFASKYDKWFSTPQGKIVKELELNLLIEFIRPEKGKKMLEVGIGTGLFALEFRERGMDVQGIDPSYEMLSIAKKRGFVVKYGTGENIPYPDKTFDVVLAMTSMEFSKEPDKIVTEMKRVAKDNGIVVVAVLNVLSFYGIIRRLKGIFRKSVFDKAHFYTYRELERLLDKHLHNIEISSSVFFPPNSPDWVLQRASSLEVFGRRHCTQFGALIIGKGGKNVH